MVTLRRLDADEARMELAGAGEIHWCQGEPTTEDLVVLGIAADGTPTWLIVDEEGDCVGMCGTHEPLLFGSTPEIGYHVVPAARRQGVASSAVALLLDELRAAGVAGVVAEVDRASAFHVASLSVLRANGFVPLAAHIGRQLFADPVEGADLLHRSLG